MTLENEFLQSKSEQPQKKTLNVKVGVKLKKVPPGAKLKDVKALFRGLAVKNVIFQKGAVAVVALGSQEAVQKALAMKDARLGNHAVLVRPLPQEAEAPNKSAGFKREFFPQRNQKDLEQEVQESGRLFFRNLSYEVTEADLDALCAPFGLITEAFVPWDGAAHRNRGFGFVSFVHPAAAVQAFRALDKKQVQGRCLHVLPAKEATAEPREEEEEAEGKTAFQKERLAKRKRTASAERAYNPLLINATALAEVQAAELGVSKEQLLDSRTRGSAAVRLAQLELALIGELEDFLKAQGAHVPSLGGKEEEGVVVRSRNAFLIKNLPAHTKEEELRPLLTRHGDLQSLKMAPKGLLAVAHFGQSVQARRAFAFVAFAEFKDSVLKVEWLPQLKTEFVEAEAEEPGECSPPKEKVSMKRKSAREDECAEEAQEAKKRKRSKKAAAAETEARSEEEEAPCKKSKKAEKASKEAEAKKASKKAEADKASKKAEAEKASKEAEKASKKAEADKASKKAEADKASKKAEKASKKAEAEKASKKAEKASKEAEAEKASKKAEKASKKAEKASKETEAEKASKEAEEEAGRSVTVVLVRNVPFQASRRELEELCRPFGSLARVRLPLKAGGGIRGFAFVEFGDEESAQALIAADKRMHLYGRRLRLEAALADSAVASVREKALASLTSSMVADQRRRREKVQLEPDL